MEKQLKERKIVSVSFNKEQYELLESYLPPFTNKGKWIKHLILVELEKNKKSEEK